MVEGFRGNTGAAARLDPISSIPCLGEHVVSAVNCTLGLFFAG